MFGCIVAGRLVQTNIQQVDVNKFTFQLDDANNINHIVVFLLGTVPFQDGFAATVHLLWPNKTWQLLGMISNTKPSAIFRLKDTAGTRAGGASDNMMMEDAMDQGSSGAMKGANSNGPPIIATLGISIEPMDVVMNQINAKSTGATRPPSNALVAVSSGAGSSAALGTAASEGTIAALGQKIITHLYNHVTSFATTTLQPGSTVLTPMGGPGSAGAFLQTGGAQAASSSYLPVKAFNEWYQTLLRKAKTDPGFLTRP